MQENSTIQTINSIFSDLFSSVDNSIYKLLDEIIFIDENIINKENFLKILGTNSSNGILLICNALILGVLIFYSINYLFSHLTYSKIQTPVQFIFKCIIFIGIMNCSLWVCSQIIEIISLISSSILDIGQNLFSEEISFSNFISKINDNVYSSNSLNITSFNGIIKSCTTIGFFNLIFSYSLRYIMIQVFVLIFPFTLLCLINDKTEWIFKNLMKSFFMLLIEQILIAIILVLAFSFDFSNSEISEILHIGIIYALIKANNFMYMIFGGISTSVGSGINMFTSKS